MYDLRVLQQMNEEAHQRAIERSEQAPPEPAAETPTAPVFPLAILTRRLIIGPPSIAYIVGLFENTEVVAAFMELVSTYLPEREDEIRVADVDQRISLFCTYFEARYFPLRDVSMMYEEEDSLEQFVSEIPVDLMGFTYEDYHEFTDFRTGYVLLMALVESPFHGEDNGGRVPIIAHVGETLGRDVAGAIPPDGWSPEFLHERTDGTRFDGVGHFADWMHSQTDCWLLDANHEDYAGENWQPHIVQELTVQWPRVCEIQDKYHQAIEFLEENPKKHFIELLDMLLDIDRNEYVIPKEQLPLFE